MFAPVWKGKSVRLVTYSDTPLNSDASVSAELWVNSIEKDKETNEEKKIPLKVQDLQSSIWSHFEGEKLQLGLLYRGWGQFAYKGDEEKNGEKKGHTYTLWVRTRISSSSSGVSILPMERKEFSGMS